jgi:Ring finger domain
MYQDHGVAVILIPARHRIMVFFNLVNRLCPDRDVLQLLLYLVIRALCASINFSWPWYVILMLMMIYGASRLCSSGCKVIEDLSIRLRDPNETMISLPSFLNQYFNPSLLNQYFNPQLQELFCPSPYSWTFMYFRPSSLIVFRLLLSFVFLPPDLPPWLMCLLVLRTFLKPTEHTGDVFRLWCIDVVFALRPMLQRNGMAELLRIVAPTSYRRCKEIKFLDAHTIRLLRDEHYFPNGDSDAIVEVVEQERSRRALTATPQSTGSNTPPYCPRYRKMRRRGESMDCIICLSTVDVGQWYFPLPCFRTHIAHRQCLDRWIQQRREQRLSLSCPTCRSQLK